VFWGEKRDRFSADAHRASVKTEDALQVHGGGEDPAQNIDAGCLLELFRLPGTIANPGRMPGDPGSIFGDIERAGIAVGQPIAARGSRERDPECSPN